MALTLHYPFLTNPSLTGHDNEGLASSTPDLSFTRATAAWDTDADGYIRKYWPGEPRFTGATWTQQLCWATDNYDDTDWSVVEATKTTGQADPFGGTGAVKITPSVNSAQHYMAQSVLYPGDAMIFSWYAKAAGYDWCFFNGSDVVSDIAFFDLANGVTGTTQANATSTITSVGDGWYRCEILVSGYTAASGVFWHAVCSQDGENGSWSGDGSSGVLFYGSQAEVADVGRTRASAFIENTSTINTPETSLSGTSTLGLKIEAARTNIALQSEDFSTTWASGGSPSTVNTNATTSPDGSTTADRLIDDSSTGTGSPARTQSVTVTSGSNTFSVFAKADQLSWLDMRSLGFDAGGDGETYFDLSTGAVGTTSANHTARIEDYGNGWYRCSVTFSTTTDLAGSILLYVAEADGDRTVDLDGTSSIFVWGAMLEAGSFPSSYIETTTTSVTRNADDVSTSDTTWQTAGVGTFYTDFTMSYLGEEGHIVSGGANARIAYVTIPGVLGTYDGSAFYQIKGPSITAGTQYKVALGYEDSTTAQTAYYNDTLADDGADSAYTAGAFDISTLTIGHRGGTAINYFNGHIAELAYWDERLDNDTLDGLSAGTTTIQAAGGGVLERKRRQHYRRQKLRAQGIRYKETWAGTYRGRRS